VNARVVRAQLRQLHDGRGVLDDDVDSLCRAARLFSKSSGKTCVILLGRFDDDVQPAQNIVELHACRYDDHDRPGNTQSEPEIDA